MSVTTLKE